MYKITNANSFSYFLLFVQPLWTIHFVVSPEVSLLIFFINSSSFFHSVIFLFLTSAPFSVLHIFLCLFCFSSLGFFFSPVSVISSRPLSFHSLVSTNLCCVFSLSDCSPPPHPHTSVSLPEHQHLPKSRSLSVVCCISFCPSFLLSVVLGKVLVLGMPPSTTTISRVWISGTMSLWWFWDQTKAKECSHTGSWNHSEKIITFYRLNKILFKQSMFLIALWLSRFTSSLRIGRWPSYNHKSTINLGKKAVPQWVLHSGGLSRCYSMLDPTPTKTHPSTIVYFCSHAGL